MKNSFFGHLKSVLVPLVFLTISSASADVRLSFDDGMNEVQKAVVGEYVSQILESLKCPNLDLETVAVKSPDFYIRHRFNGFSRSNRVVKAGDRTAFLYMADGPEIWANTLSTCAESEDLTVVGVGQKAAFQNMLALSKGTPILQSSHGYFGQFLPLEAMLAFENKKNLCQSMNELVKKAWAKGTFVPKGRPLSGSELKDALTRLWDGQSVTFSGVSSLYDLSVKGDNQRVIEEFLKKKQKKLFFRFSNLKMAKNPTDAAQKTLAGQIEGALQNGESFHVLQRMGGNYFGEWHALLLLRGRWVENDQFGPVMMIDFYDSNEGAKFQQLAWIPSRSRFFSIQNGQIFSERHLWKQSDQKVNE